MAETTDPTPADDMRDHTTIHIAIYEAAPDAEVDEFWDDLAEFLGEWMEAHPERGQWDPYMRSHREACEDSDHCYGPGSNAERRMAAESLRVVARVIRNDPDLRTCSHDVPHGMDDWIEGRADQIDPTGRRS